MFVLLWFIFKKCIQHLESKANLPTNKAKINCIVQNDLTLFHVKSYDLVLNYLYYIMESNGKPLHCI